MIKEKVLEAAKELPKEFDLEEFIEKLIFIDKVEKGIKQLDEGKTLHHDEVKNAQEKHISAHLRKNKNV